MIAALGRAGQRDAFYFKPVFSMMYRQFLRTPAARAQRDRIGDAAAECGAIWEQAWLGFRTPEADQTGIGAQINCPVLFTWASRDPIVSSRAAKTRSAASRITPSRSSAAAIARSSKSRKSFSRRSSRSSKKQLRASSPLGRSQRQRDRRCPGARAPISAAPPGSCALPHRPRSRAPGPNRRGIGNRIRLGAH